jgi:protein TonB
MTYVQRLARFPLPEFSGRTVVFAVVFALHVILVSAVVDGLRRTRAPAFDLPTPATLLPDPELADPRQRQVQAIEPVVDWPVVAPIAPIIEFEEREEATPLDARPYDEGSGSSHEPVAPVRSLPRQDPGHPLGRPAYPPTSIRLNEAGVVLLNVCVDAVGRTTGVTVLSGSGYRRLDEAAIVHMRRSAVRLLPGLEDGVPTPMCTGLRFRFGFDGD